jgi:hypothetical protein
MQLNPAFYPSSFPLILIVIMQRRYLHHGS